MEGFGASVAVASRLAELIDHGLLVENIFVNCKHSSESVPYRQPEDDVNRENVLNAAVQRLWINRTIHLNATCESERESVLPYEII